MLFEKGPRSLKTKEVSQEREGGELRGETLEETERKLEEGGVEKKDIKAALRFM